MLFKNEKDRELFLCLHPILIMIYADLFHFAKSRYDIDLVVTSTVSTLAEDKVLGRTSAAHRECRAIDIRTRDVDSFIVQDLIDYINNKKEYNRFHYVSNRGEKRLAYFHIGTASHIHLSIHSQFKKGFKI